jgi:sec-independent protein translocase protein TatB
VLNFSPEKLLLVGIIALVVLGPHRLPQAARTFGRFMAQLRHMSQSFQDEVRGVMDEPVDSIRSVAGDFRPPDLRRMVRDTISSTLNPSSTLDPDPATPSRPAPPSGPAAMPVVPPAPDDPSFN